MGRDQVIANALNLLLFRFDISLLFLGGYFTVRTGFQVALKFLKKSLFFRLP